MDLGIKNKRVLVTGASQGIGKSIALEFANEGCRITLISRREQELKKVMEEIGGEDCGHSYMVGDLMEKGVPTTISEELIKQYKRVDIVVHNVGGTLGVKNILSSVEDWEKVWRFNTGIAIEMNNILIPPMQRNEWGRIIHISSISAKNLRGSGPYGIAKAALNAYTTVLGRELAPQGIVVSALMPGAIFAVGGHWDENSPHNAIDKEAFFRKKSDFLRHHHAIGRMGLSEEIAPFAVYMASKQASFANTALIPIDGGTM